MKVKIELENGQTLEQAEEELLRALKGKQKVKDEPQGERYADTMVNEFHDLILDEHEKVLEGIQEQIETEVKRLVSSKGNI
jgi:hypothetical protein